MSIDRPAVSVASNVWQLGASRKGHARAAMARAKTGSFDLAVGAHEVPGVTAPSGEPCEDGPATSFTETRFPLDQDNAPSPHDLTTRRPSFDGKYILLPQSLPLALAIPAAGNPVGSLVGTGIPTLDAARIVSVETDCDGDLWIEVEAEEVPARSLRD